MLKQTDSLHLAPNFGAFLKRYIGDQITFEHFEGPHLSHVNPTVSVKYNGEKIGFVIKDQFTVAYIGKIPNYQNPKSQDDKIMLEQQLFGDKKRVDGHRSIAFP